VRNHVKANVQKLSLVFQLTRNVLPHSTNAEISSVTTWFKALESFQILKRASYLVLVVLRKIEVIFVRFVGADLHIPETSSYFDSVCNFWKFKDYFGRIRIWL